MKNRLSQLFIALTTIGLLVSIYMTIYKFMPDNGMCLGSHGCPIVNASKYSEVNGVPVAVLGVLGYAAILAVVLLEQKINFLQQNGTLVFFGISLTGFFFYAVFDLCRSCPGPGRLSILHHITERDDPHLHPLGHPRGTTTLIPGGKHAPY